jgi:hypothetical protein
MRLLLRKQLAFNPAESVFVSVPTMNVDAGKFILSQPKDRHDKLSRPQSLFLFAANGVN